MALSPLCLNFSLF